MAELLLEDLSRWEMTCIIGVAAGLQILFVLKDFLSRLFLSVNSIVFLLCVDNLWTIIYYRLVTDRQKSHKLILMARIVFIFETELGSLAWWDNFCNSSTWEAEAG